MTASPDQHAPVILVGLPRSGSTLMARLLNESPDVLVVNDLYYLQQVDACRAFDTRDPARLEPAVRWLVKRIRGRSTNGGARQLTRSLQLTSAALDQIESHAWALNTRACNWSEILAGVLSLAARLEGKAAWGYKTPQDFMHVDRLRQSFPGAKFVYVFRDPYSTLRSYKNADDLRRNLDSRRYHPVVQSLYWRSCARHYLDQTRRCADDVIAIRYEDLLDGTDAAIRRATDFLGVRPGFLDLGSAGTNTSGIRQQLTATEQWLCGLVIGNTMSKLGYTKKKALPRVGDGWQLLEQTARTVHFHATNATRSGDARNRLRHFVRQSLRLT